MAPDVTFSGPNTISSATLPPMHTSIFANICPERKVKCQLKIIGNDPILNKTDKLQTGEIAGYTASTFIPASLIY